ncbi:hypothetical protein [Acidomonas methanolica]|uniref:Phage shock protein B n=1 Tax=Acidomonas methanolica NBRC 104435 TaxID=1231351 RepID=A0A023D4K8_ACIMT|nr:hypothetical protein [Acidomonas methanolica]MBU2655599.1 phage shock protein B [Acidomonas methanolica]TCS21548.1 phage shock protein B [Acidomonas methanolica]GAJ29077.1 hypothetical protein Amme_046_006 [Acidomonas methanolica NBRC 104435]GBQ48165.1 hypothetical protein AA0498_0703 [Acidomonas methanolica]GEL00430.1 hypothetical protein AME01nite_29280 [Acidomonas methanolica NBRC 104435]
MNDIDGILAILLIFGLPFFGMWLWYRAGRERRMSTSVGEAGWQALDQAQVMARRLEERVEQLERILDEDVPGWRAKGQQ